MPAAPHPPRPPRSPRKATDGFRDFEEAFFRAGDASAAVATAPSKWRRAASRLVAVSIFSAALAMAWHALGPILRAEASSRMQIDRAAVCARIVGDREAWVEPVVAERAPTPRQRPHSTTAARSRRR